MNRNLILFFIAILFFTGIVLFSYKQFEIGLLAVLVLVITYFLTKTYRTSVSLFIFFLLGLMMFQIGSNYIDSWDISVKMKTLINRSFLIFIVLGTVVSLILSKQKLSVFALFPDWSKSIKLPFHSIKLHYFLLIGLLGSSTILIPIISYQEISYIQTMLIFGIVFAIINATLEEVIWRGFLLSGLRRNVSTIYAVFITSIGFGLLHLSIGIPIMLSLLFSFGGLFYALVVLKTNSIYPAIMFHVIINLGMVFNGWII
ncbi:CPBP family intramembrane glutamic endopeptidase [Guptibacillus algicola]|uniref:CPBP family intramembrane glutamic endopeptidase n=1 Tax=Guptibacillus algicola TaxID=225844 RepID=UPI001CD76658|nr:type II CAAX endopeptidase family protein [Alkalihalobacillus algicola]MCA0987402.1 CPBP family intramembrane metalloprotease [Alkalihalobacillus algicola]